MNHSSIVQGLSAGESTEGPDDNSIVVPDNNNDIDNYLNSQMQIQTQTPFAFGPQRITDDMVDEYGGQDLNKATNKETLSEIAKRNLIMNKTMSVMTRKRAN
jgi:hypothetical protein